MIPRATHMARRKVTRGPHREPPGDLKSTTRATGAAPTFSLRDHMERTSGATRKHVARPDQGRDPAKGIAEVEKAAVQEQGAVVHAHRLARVGAPPLSSHQTPPLTMGSTCGAADGEGEPPETSGVP